MSAVKNVTANFDIITYALTVNKTGNGSISSTPAGITCGTDCTETYSTGTTVTLTATPATGYTFSNWAGCNSTSGMTCTVSMSAAKTVTATFTPIYTLTVSKTGKGTGMVTSSPIGINCGTDCSEPYLAGTTVKLTATPMTGSKFTGWSSACTGTATCTVSLATAKYVTANFASP
jgi:hypothetical protein